MPENEPPKIIIDSDWKSQAQAERDRLARAEQEAAAKKAAERKPAAPAAPGAAPAGAPADPGAPDDGLGAMPPADFPSLVGTLVTQALMYMGAFPDESGRAMVSLDHARFYIDLLGVLEDKTKGNLTAEQAEDLKRALYELRIRYVEITKAVEAAARKQGGVQRPQIPGGPSMMGR